MTEYDITNIGPERLSIVVEADNKQDAIEQAVHILDGIDMTDLSAVEVDG